MEDLLIKHWQIAVLLEDDEIRELVRHFVEADENIELVIKKDTYGIKS